MSYATFKANVLGKHIGDSQCVALVVNNPQAWAEVLYPSVVWTNIFAPVVGARQLFSDANPAYFTPIANDHNNPSQIPQQGDIMVFDATPHVGYTNTFVNPYGHTGLCDSADASGYNLLQQNAPASGAPVNVTHYAWNVRPCIGWLRPVVHSAPAPVPTPVAQHNVYLPPSSGLWHLYPANGPYVYSSAKGILAPANYGGLTYKIVADRGNGILNINTIMYGNGDIYTKGSNVVIT
jgi:hypothetical protein